MQNAILISVMYKSTIDEFVSQYKKILGDNLVGIYLHGSFAMDCGTENSDIDLLVVVNNKLDYPVHRKLIRVTLGLKNVPAKGIEVSAVLKEHCQNFIYPTPFVLHYSDNYMEKALNDESFILGKEEDKDLICHFMMTKHRGVRLYGEKIDSVFSDVPEDLFIKSIVNDITDAKTQIYSEPVYHILNLCRTWAYLDDKKVLSKLEGGNWAINKLPVQFTDLVQKAINNYSDASISNTFNTKISDDFCQYIFTKINDYIKI